MADKLIGAVEDKDMDKGYIEKDGIMIGTNTGDNNMFDIAAVIPTAISDAPSYIDSVKDFNTDTLAHDQEIKICRKLSSNEGSVATSLDVLIELAITDGYITNCSDELRLILEYWVENVNNIRPEDKKTPDSTRNPQPEISQRIPGIYNYCENMLWEYYVTGDAVSVDHWQKIPISIANKSGTYILPTSLFTYLVEDLEISDALRSLGREIIYLKIDQKLIDAAKNTQSEEYKAIKGLLSPLLAQAIAGGKDKIPLPAVLVTHMKRRGNGQQYGTSYLRKAFSAVAQKRRLQALDTATITGLIQQLIIMTVGHDDYRSPYHVPKPGRVALLKAVLNKTSTNKLFLWGGPDLKAITIGPDGSVLGFEGRFKECDDNISMSLGIPRLLIDGASTGASSRDWSVFISTIAKLAGVRRMLASKITQLLQQIARYNGFGDEFPRWEWSPIQLRSESTLKAHAIKAFEDGLLSRQDTLILTGSDPDKVIKRQIQEKEMKLSEQIEQPKVAFSSPAGDPAAPNKGGPGGGRPTGKTEPTPRNQNKASIEVADAYWSDILNGNFDSIKDAVSLCEHKHDACNNISLGFIAIERTMAIFLKAEIARRLPSEKAGEWHIPLLGWNNSYLVNLKKQIIDDMPDDKAQWDVYLEKFRDRLGMYQTQGMVKIDVACKLSGLEDKGFTSFKSTPTENACDLCQKQVGLSYGKREAFQNMPAHIGCNCGIEGV